MSRCVLSGSQIGLLNPDSSVALSHFIARLALGFFSIISSNVIPGSDRIDLSLLLSRSQNPIAASLADFIVWNVSSSHATGIIEDPVGT